MSQPESELSQPNATEDFPFEAYMLLEKRLKTLRLYVMREAAALAGDARVERKHIETVLNVIAKHPEVLITFLVPEGPVAEQTTPTHTETAMAG